MGGTALDGGCVCGRVAQAASRDHRRARAVGLSGILVVRNARDAVRSELQSSFNFARRLFDRLLNGFAALEAGRFDLELPEDGAREPQVQSPGHGAEAHRGG